MIPIRQAIKQHFKARITKQGPDAGGPQAPAIHHTQVDSSPRSTLTHPSSSSDTAPVFTQTAEASVPSNNTDWGSTSTDLWARALESLSAKHRAAHQVPQQPSRDIIDHLCALSQQKRTECEEQRWKVEIDGHQVILRDVAEKFFAWLHKFKEIGDVIVNYDPVHLALPWAGIRFLLQVGIFLTPIIKLCD